MVDLRIATFRMYRRTLFTGCKRYFSSILLSTAILSRNCSTSSSSAHKSMSSAHVGPAIAYFTNVASSSSIFYSVKEMIAMDFKKVCA